MGHFGGPFKFHYMANILNELLDSVGGSNMGALSQILGADENKTKTAMTVAVPLLVQALSRNVQTANGAKSLDRALAKDHDGSIFGNLSGLLQNPESGNGMGILKHIFGGKQDVVNDFVGQKSGLSAGNAGKLMTVLAPLLLGLLGKNKNSQGLNFRGIYKLLQGAARSTGTGGASKTDLNSILGGKGMGIGMKILSSFLSRRK